GALTLQSGTLVANQDATSGATVENGGTLTLTDSTITGGTLTVDGTLDSTGVSFITGTSISNVSHIHVVSGTLTIDPAGVTNSGTIEVGDGATLVLDGETVTNSVTDAGGTTNGTMQVDATDASHFATLDLQDSTINGGNVTIAGLLYSTGASA